MGWDLSPDVAHEMHMSTWRDLDKDIELSMDDQLPSTENAPPAPPLAALWETPSDYPYSNYRITYYEQSVRLIHSRFPVKRPSHANAVCART